MVIRLWPRMIIAFPPPPLALRPSLRPFWLSPRQALIVPVAQRYIEYAISVKVGCFCLFFFPFFLCVLFSLCAFLYSSCLSVCLSVGRSVGRSVGLSVCRSVGRSIGLSVCLSVGSSVCPFVFSLCFKGRGRERALCLGKLSDRVNACLFLLFHSSFFSFCCFLACLGATARGRVLCGR